MSKNNAMKKAVNFYIVSELNGTHPVPVKFKTLISSIKINRVWVE